VLAAQTGRILPALRFVVIDAGVRAAGGLA
jgi:hypothetical protein